MPRLAWLVAATAALATAAIAGPDFDPSSYPHRVAQCDKVNINYVEINPSGSRTLLFVHGWPGLWSNWANQIAFFAKDERYRIIVPDQRGFGASTYADPASFHALAGDLVCVLKDAGVPDGQNTVCIGHDWGSQVCYEALRGHPDVFEGASGTIPYIPAAGPFVPIEQVAKQLTRLTYQIYFERDTVVAAEELEKDVRRTLRALYRGIANPPPSAFLTSRTDFLGAYDGVPLDERIAFLSEKEEDYLVKAYEKTGFKNSLQFYTHPFRFESHEYASKTGRKIVDQPTALIYPDEDPVADWLKAAELLHSRTFMSNLTVYKVNGAHWLQLENPKAFNEALKTWLETFPKKQDPTAKVEEIQLPPIAEEPLLEPLLHEEL